jgi:hypothetical protein
VRNRRADLDAGLGGRHGTQGAASANRVQMVELLRGGQRSADKIRAFREAVRALHADQFADRFKDVLQELADKPELHEDEKER